MNFHNSLRWAIQIVIVFIVGIVIARNYLVVGSIGSGFDSPYKNFYSKMDNAYDLYYDRSCNNLYNLESRKKVRWVVKKAFYTLLETSYESFGVRGLAVTFLSLHALFIVLCFVFIKLTIASILNSSKFLIQSESSMLLLFLTLTLFVFNGRVAGFSFSIIEATCVAAALYFSKIRKIVPFTLVVMLAVLNRESGFLIFSLWFVFNQKIEKSLFYFLTPFALFFYVNSDILACMLDYNFFMGSPDYRPSWNINSIGDFLSFVGAVVFNYGVFFILMSTILYLSKHRSVFFNEIKNIYMIYVLYTFVLITATPVSHMSSKFIIIPLIVVVTVIYRSNHIIHSEQ
jgi:hypothetical protein